MVDKKENANNLDENHTNSVRKRPRIFGVRRAAKKIEAPEEPVEVRPSATPDQVSAVEADRDVVSSKPKSSTKKVPVKKDQASGDAKADAKADTEVAAAVNAKTDAKAEVAAKKPVGGNEPKAPRTRAKASSSKAAADAPSEVTPAPATTSLPPATTSLPPATTSLIFQAPDIPQSPHQYDGARYNGDEPTVRRRSRRRSEDDVHGDHRDLGPNTVVKVRTPRQQPEPSNEPQRVKGSTRLEAKKQRRRDGRDAGRRRPVITEAEFLARRESVDRVMVVRSKADRIQIAVLEDDVLVEHYVAKAQDASLIGNVYLGRVQNVLPSMEAAFVDIGRGRNAVLYSGEVDWDAAETGNQPRRIELALKAGDTVLVQVTKDPVGHKGARLTSQVSLPGRYLVYVPNGSMNGISRKLPDTERARLKKILKEVLPENVGVIVRTAAEGATEEQLTLDVNRLTAQWAEISAAVEKTQGPTLLHSEPDLLVKIVRDVFNEDFRKLIIEGDDAKATIEAYLRQVAPDLLDRVERYSGDVDSFDRYRISEQIEKALDRKVWLPSGGSLVIDRTEAMTVIDVNTGKFVGSGGNLEETVTKNNLEAAEEIVRQLRLRDIGGIIVVDFIDMVLESNRDLVLRRLVECLSRDRTKHQVAEVTSLGLVQMTRKKLGLGLIESFSEPCEVCAGRGIIVQHDPVTKHRQTAQPEVRRNRGKGGSGDSGRSQSSAQPKGGNGTHAITEDVKNALAQIAASTITANAPVLDTHAVETAPAAQADVAAPAARGSDEEVRSTERTSAKSETAPAAPEGTAAPSPSTEPPAEPEATVEILDIPVKKAQRTPRRISPKDAEQILDSVLEALPEPKPFGQGRSRSSSRRASSAGSATKPAAQPVPPPEGDGPVILGVGVSASDL